MYSIYYVGVGMSGHFLVLSRPVPCDEHSFEELVLGWIDEALRESEPGSWLPADEEVTL